MVYNPRLIAEVLPYGKGQWVNNNAIRLPVFQATVDNVIGVTSDWFSVKITNKDREFDWLFDGIDSHEVKIYAFDSTLPPIASNEEVMNEARQHCIMHGWLGPVDMTMGSEVDNILTLKGGDCCYRLNKIFSGDKYFANTAVAKGEVVETVDSATKQKEMHQRMVNAVKSGSPWNVMNQMLLLDANDETNGIRIMPSQSFRDLRVNVSGLCQQSEQYNFDMINADSDTSKIMMQYYQSNNSSLLEIIDDICTKTGYDATTIPGTKTIIIYNNDDVEKGLNVLIYDALINGPKTEGGGARSADATMKPYDDYMKDVDLYIKGGDRVDPLNVALYSKITKYPGFEDGIELSMIHWDWQKTDGSGRLRKDKKEYVSSAGVFQGSLGRTNDAKVNVIKVYENIPQEAMDRKLHRALNRICCNRVSGYLGLPSGNPAVMPGKSFTLHGAGFFSGDYNLADGKQAVDSRTTHSYLANKDTYLITSVKRKYSASGFMTTIMFRLADLQVAQSEAEMNIYPYQSIYLGHKRGS